MTSETELRDRPFEALARVGAVRRTGPLKGANPHPSQELWSAYRLGNVSPGLGLALAGHLDFCRQCRVSLAPADRPFQPQPARHGPGPTGAAAQRRGDDEPLPPALGGIALGPWRRVGRGLHTALMQQVSGLGESVFLVKAGPTVTLTIPTAADFLVVLHGTFASSEATYQPGSFLDLSPMRRTGLTSGRRQGGLALMVGDDRLYRRVVHDWLAGLGRR